jgi:hypothetical protein
MNIPLTLQMFWLFDASAAAMQIICFLVLKVSGTWPTMHAIDPFDALTLPDLSCSDEPG